MEEKELLYRLLLKRTEGIGDVLAKKLILHFGNATQLYQAGKKDLLQIHGLGDKLVKAIVDQKEIINAELELNWNRKHNIRAVFFDSNDYPFKLTQIPDNPFVIFVNGNLRFYDRPVISIVGTRNATNYGVKLCERLIEELSPLQPIIVSGYALGIDIVAHRSAFTHQLETWAVLAHGLDRIYPKEHMIYKDNMLSRGGFISEFSKGVGPERENFVRRNRIVAGISDATIVIESSEKGGSLITAQYAFDYDRDVFAFPGRVGDKYSEGCLKLLRTQKAHIITNAADLLYAMQWDVLKKNKVIQREMFVDLDANEDEVYQCIVSSSEIHIDELLFKLQSNMSQLGGILLSLELKGAIEVLPGKRYVAIPL